MTRKAKTIVGFCPTLADAEEAVDRLRLSGFRNTDVSALRPDSVIVGGALRWAAGPGIPKQEARQHEVQLETFISTGGIVLCVSCNNADWVRRAQNVFERRFAAAC
jgi:cell division septation protein DedD